MLSLGILGRYAGIQKIVAARSINGPITAASLSCNASYLRSIFPTNLSVTSVDDEDNSGIETPPDIGFLLSRLVKF